MTGHPARKSRRTVFGPAAAVNAGVQNAHRQMSCYSSIKTFKKCFDHGVLRRAAYDGEDRMEQHFQRRKPLAPHFAA